MKFNVNALRFANLILLAKKKLILRYDDDAAQHMIIWVKSFFLFLSLSTTVVGCD